jgi:hypothetical protein
MAEKKAKIVEDKELEVKAPAGDFVEPADEEKEWAKNDTAEFSGKYIKAVGRRKRAVAKVRLYEGGKGVIMVNGLRAAQYFRVMALA